MMKMRSVRYLVLAVGMLALLLACAPPAPTATSTPSATPVPLLEQLGLGGDVIAPSPTPMLIVTSTTAPTATPDPISIGVQIVAYETGLESVFFLGLSTSEWINLGISLVYVLAGYLVGTGLVRGILARAVRRTASPLDDRLLHTAGPDVRRLVVLLTAEYATRRLGFLSPDAKDVLGSIYFAAAVLVSLHALWQVVTLVGEWYLERASRTGHREQFVPIVTLLQRVTQVVFVIIGISILLSHFGLNVTAFAAALGLGGLAVSLGARDTIADTIAGFIILVDRPFRIGNRIEIQEVGTWGDVVEIGVRTTRIRTRDNRVVIVPNSRIGQNQVINYSYPDPRYRVQTHLGVAYGTDIPFVEGIIRDTVPGIEGVLPEEPVDVLYDEMGDFAMKLCVRWWIASYADMRQVLDRVHRALQKALDEAGVEMPYPTQTLEVHTRPARGDQQDR